MKLLANITFQNFRNVYYEIKNFINHYSSCLKIKYITPRNPKKIHLGCGYIRMKGYLNIDIFKTEAVDFTLDLRRKLPFKNNSIKHIFSEHVFEHFDTKELYFILQGCHRILKDGGKLNFSIPDYENFTKNFLNNKRGERNKALESFKKDQVRLGGPSWEEDIFYLDHLIHQWGQHKFFYTYEVIKELLERAGFRKTVKRKWKRNLDSPTYRKYFSLYVFAIK